MRDSPDPHEVFRLVESIGQVLTGRDPAIQSAVLADLLATWLAGHIAVGDDRATKRLRERLLSEHIKLVRRLLPVNHGRIHG